MPDSNRSETPAHDLTESGLPSAGIHLARPVRMTVALRVMTYNIQGHAVLKRAKHIGEIVTVIRQLRPDVIGLQEVHRGTHHGRSGDQIEEIASATKMQLFFGRTIERLGGEYGSAVLTTGTIESGVTHPLGGRGEPRNVLSCSVNVRDFRFTFLVAHLAAWFRFHRGSRTEQIRALQEVIHPGLAPFVLVGDFNASPRAPEMQQLIRSENLRLAGEHGERSHALSRQRLDYIFTDPSWSAESSWVVPLGPSDHWPLVADLVSASS